MQGRKTKWAGVTQGKLTVIREVGKNSHGSILWECVCACGAVTTKSGDSLKKGVKSCSTACGVVDSNKARTIHGQASNGKPTKVYQTWVGINRRCTNPNYAAFHRYGGRGITVCDEWAVSFDAFYSHVGDPPSAKHTLDRIDNDRGYEPGNVRWATRKEQANNRSTNVYLEHENKRMTLKQWAEYLGIDYDTLFSRVEANKPTAEVLAPAKKYREPK